MNPQQPQWFLFTSIFYRLNEAQKDLDSAKKSTKREVLYFHEQSRTPKRQRQLWELELASVEFSIKCSFLKKQIKRFTREELHESQHLEGSSDFFWIQATHRTLAAVPSWTSTIKLEILHDDSEVDDDDHSVVLTTMKKMMVMMMIIIIIFF